ncbi:MAG TPA: TonB-dependent receptor, partial [Fodinibius sp.]|nr:TonB-dependent receptor [Fodinibius sp.]
SMGGATDAQGSFNLQVPSLQDTLVFSFIGYQTREIPINGRTEINISLSIEALSGDELVVVGYGTQEKQNLTGSISSIGGEKISEQATIQASSALMGQSAGVTVTQTSGRPGDDQGAIRIRGIGSLETGAAGKNNPLVLIDGVEGSLGDLAPSDIQDITVLKDAASASIYGSRAANGVILVTTKRASSSDVQVNYKAYAGVQRATETVNPVNGGEYMQYHNMALENAGRATVWEESYIDEWFNNYQSDPVQYPNSDWIGAALSRDGFMQNHDLSVSGGSGNVLFFGSLSFQDQNGNMPNTDFERYGLRFNTDVNVSDKFEFDFDLNLSRSNRMRPPLANVKEAYRLPRIYGPVKNPDGSWGPHYNDGNPIATLYDGGTQEQERNYVKGNLKATYSPVENLEINFRYAPEYANNFTKNMNKTFMVENKRTGVVNTGGAPARLFQAYRSSLTHNINLIVDYQQSFAGNHQLDVKGGYEFIKFGTQVFDAYREGFTIESLEELNAASQSNMRNSGTSSNYTIQSVFGRGNYNYNDRYLLEANLRYDGSSRFAPSNRYGLFPSFSAGWRIANEAFMNDVDFISNLKIRASWGQLGNQQISTYPYVASFNLGHDYILGGQAEPGAAQLALANKNISWETSISKNIGLDVAFFENKLSFSSEYYVRDTEDILIRLPIPGIVGRTAPFQNAGKVRNKGWEFSLNYSDQVSENFSYEVGLNLSNNENEVLDLKGAGPFIGGATITREGDPINAIYAYEALGYFQRQEEIDNHASQGSNIAPGDIKYKDQLTVDTDGDGVPDEADGVINADDRTVVGDAFPNLPFGINLAANYKAFDISALFQGYGSRDVRLGGYTVTAFQNLGNMYEWQKDFWAPDNRDAAYPRLYADSQHNNFQPSDFWVYDASYIRLRNIQVGYTLPTSVTQRLPISNLRVYAQGQNIVTWDNMPPGIDPNVNNGASGGMYPITASYTLGLNVQ